MKPQELKISQDELLRKLQSGELVVLQPEVVERLSRERNVTTPAVETLPTAEELRQSLHIGPPAPGLRINLGSGQRPFEKPWINVDCQPRWNPDVLADGSDLHEHFADDSADVIVLHHVLEHFGCGEAHALLKECYRVLRPGGSLIVTVPDIAILCRAYLNQWNDGYPIINRDRTMDTQLFMTNVYGAYMGDDADRHKWGFDTDSLYKTLYHIGPWTEIKGHDWRALSGADIARDWWILGVEAVK